MTEQCSAKETEKLCAQAQDRPIRHLNDLVPDSEMHGKATQGHEQLST